jgi:hypothetical protein
MANPRYRALLLAAALPSLALRPATLHAQAQSGNPSYSDMAAAAQQAKKGEAAPPATTAPAATTTPDPAAAQATAAVPPAETAAAPAAAGTATAAGTEAAAAPPTVPPPPKMQRTLFGKMKPVKEKPPKLLPVNVVHGELTVDGLIAKAGLNFQIVDLKFFYIWVPGLGTAIVSNEPFPDAKVQANALDGKVLTVQADGHQLQLACDQPLLNEKKPKPINMFVAVDRSFDKGSAYPEFGYGNVLKAPYAWPGTLADLHPNGNAPPLPANLRQKTETVKTCKKNADGTEGECKTAEVPLVLGKPAKPGKTS